MSALQHAQSLELGQGAPDAGGRPANPGHPAQRVGSHRLAGPPMEIEQCQEDVALALGKVGVFAEGAAGEGYFTHGR
jgi:hypothetical protein